MQGHPDHHFVIALKQEPKKTLRLPGPPSCLVIALAKTEALSEVEAGGVGGCDLCERHVFIFSSDF